MGLLTAAGSDQMVGGSMLSQNSAESQRALKLLAETLAVIACTVGVLRIRTVGIWLREAYRYLI